MSYFKPKMHQIRFRLGLRPRPRWGSSQRSPSPLAGFKRVLLLREGKDRGGGGGREGKKGGRKGREKGREGEGREGEGCVMAFGRPCFDSQCSSVCRGFCSASGLR